MTIQVATSACRRVRLSEECGCSDGLLGLLVNTGVRTMEFSLPFVCMLKSTTGIGMIMEMCMHVSFCFVGSHKVNTMAIGDKLDKKVLFDPRAKNALLIQSTQTALMKFMELFAHSVFFFFFSPYSHISV